MLFLAFLFTFSVEAKSLKIGVISDMNGSACKTDFPTTSTTAYKNLLEQHQLDHLVMTGDAVAGGCPSYSGTVPYQTVVRKMWEEFDEKFFQPAIAQQSADLILAPGNHDAPYLSANSGPNYRTENEEFARFWLNNKNKLNVEPVNVPGSNYPFFWAYTYEDVFFLVLHSTRTQILSNASEQKKFILAALRSPQAVNARARIAFGHVPPYAVLDPSVGSKYKEILEKEQVGNAGSLTDILLDHNVNILLVGHSHAPYPGELIRNSDRKRLKILSMPCGHAPRKLYGKSEVSPRGFAVLNITEANEIFMSVYNGADGKEIPPSYFPASIPQGNKVSYRRGN
jgi:Icc-related predicted phosphoesterase